MNIKKEAKRLAESLASVSDTKVDIVSLEWVLQNAKELTKKFTSKFKKSPYSFVVKIPTTKGFMLFSNDNDFRNMNNVSYLKWSVIKKMGCPHSVKNRFIK